MNDYMETPHELTKQPDAYGAFAQIANGDVAVFNFLCSFWNFEHVFDDLLDESTWDDVKKEQAYKALHDFVVDLLLNPFVRVHALDLRAVLVSAITRNIDGDAMSKSDNKLISVLAPAVRCADIDVITHVAYLHRGWEVMRAVSKNRDYDTQ